MVVIVQINWLESSFAMGDANIHCRKGATGMFALRLKELLLIAFTEYSMGFPLNGPTIIRAFGYSN